MEMDCGDLHNGFARVKCKDCLDARAYADKGNAPLPLPPCKPPRLGMHSSPRQAAGYSAKDFIKKRCDDPGCGVAGANHRENMACQRPSKKERALIPIVRVR